MILLKTGTVLYIKQVHCTLKDECRSFTRFDSFKLRSRLKWCGFVGRLPDVDLKLTKSFVFIYLFIEFFFFFK